MNKFQIRLKKLMKEDNLTQTELASKCDISQESISKYLLGKREPSMNVVVKMANALEVTLEYLTGGEVDLIEKKNYIVDVLKKYELEAPFMNPSDIPDEDLSHFESDIVIMLKKIREKYKQRE